MLIVIIFFLRIQIVSTTDSVNDSLVDNNTNISNQIENSCFNFHPQSCSGVCGQFFELWCSCDEYCQVYERCCFDFKTVCKEESETYRVRHENMMNVSIECDSNISGFAPQQIITSCSDTNISSKAVELCQAETGQSTMVSKVMSRRTELHYKNRYCMLCNGELSDDVVYWPTVVGTLSRKEEVFTIQDVLKLFQNPIRTIPPPNSTEIICVPQLVSSCQTLATSEEQRLCKENPVSPILHKGEIYKNTFCLQCNVDIHVVLRDYDYEVCHPADKLNIFHGKHGQPFFFSMILNWKMNRTASVLLDSKSFIENLSCSLDTHDHLQSCKINKCVGTLPVINDSCHLIDDHFGCLRYIFKINFTIPLDSNSDKVLGDISSKLVRITTDLERGHNITKYYNQTVLFHDITVVNNDISGFIILSKLAYHLCVLKFNYLSSGVYFEYLDNKLFVDMNGSIGTCRYMTQCYSWCTDWSETQLQCTQYQRYFTANTTNTTNTTNITTNPTTSIASFATTLTPCYIYVMFLIQGIVLTDWASFGLQNRI